MNDKADIWFQKQHEFLLPVDYFLITFTLPSELRLLAQLNQKIVYNMLFKASADALKTLAADPRAFQATSTATHLDRLNAIDTIREQRRSGRPVAADDLVDRSE